MSTLRDVSLKQRLTCAIFKEWQNMLTFQLNVSLDISIAAAELTVFTRGQCTFSSHSKLVCALTAINAPIASGEAPICRYS